MFQSTVDGVRINPRAVRRGLRLGTCLSGAAVALMLVAPASAHAATGFAAEGSVTSALGAGPHRPAFAASMVPPQDLTIRPDRPAVATAAAAGSGITLSGNGAVSVSGTANAAGDVTIEIGDVTTHGYREDGILANTNYGGDDRSISIDAGNVLTTGVAASGIRADAYTGSININAASVNTTGYGSDAIYAGTWEGDATVHVGAVSTEGAGGRGITVYSGGTTTVVADSVTISGAGLSSDFDAGGIKAVGAAVNVDVGSVSTSGDYSVGIYANSNLIHDNGQGDHDINVKAGIVTTTGLGSDGVHVLNVNEGGNINVDVEQVATRGDYSVGIKASAEQSGNVNVTAGLVSTYGFASDGIVALNAGPGNTTVSANDVRTVGAHSFGVFAAGYGDVLVSAGSVKTQGYGSTGIEAISFGGDVVIDASEVQTTGDSAVGIHAVNYSSDGSVTINGDSVTTKRDYAVGIQAEAYGSVQVTADTVATNGYLSDGINAVSVNGDVSIHANSVTTAGNSAFGVRASAYHEGSALDVQLGSVTVLGDDLVGVYASGRGPSNVTVGSITTSGDHVAAMEGLFSGYYSGPGDVADTATIKIGTITTTGDGGKGVLLAGQDMNLDLVVDTVTTSGGRSGGGFSEAVDLFTFFGDIKVVAGELSTSGDGSTALSATAIGGALDITTVRSIKTQGQHAAGILTNSFGFDQTITNLARITTAGYHSTGISAIADSGDLTITSTGAVATSGDHSEGIVALVLDGNASVAASTIMTSGSQSDGLIVGTAHLSDYSPVEHKIDIKTGMVQVTGAGSRGIYADSYGAIKADTGNTISATAQAILLRANDTASLNVRGVTTSGATEAISITGADVALAVAAGGSIAGATDGVVLSAVGPYVPPPYQPYVSHAVVSTNAAAAAPVSGNATVTNAGTITGGTGYAILVSNGVANISNSGRIDGAVKLGVNDDIVTNSGTFNATKDSDFGTGTDLFTNSGTVRLMTVAASNVSFLGLEKFDNRGGLVDLRNGHSGDVFTLTGDYVGSGDASLALDVKGAAADKFVIQGAATGKTKVILGLAAGEAALTGDKPIVVIKAGAGSAADAFEIASSNIGFIQYGLSYDAANQSYGLAGTAGNAVYRSLKIGEGAQAIWHKAANAWGSHMAELRDIGGTSPDRRLWGQLFGQIDTRDESRTVAVTGGGAQSYDLGYRQDYYGVQLGYDLGTDGAVAWGLTGGYIGSKLDYAGAAETVNFDVLNLGGYAGYQAGAFFASALVKYDLSFIRATSAALGYSDRFEASSYGAEVEAGMRLGSDGFYAEPVASIAWLSTSLDDLAALGQTIDFDTASGLRGKLGARIGGSKKLAHGSTMIFYGGGAIVHEFAGTDGATLVSGGTTDHVGNARIGTFGQGVVGLNIQSAGAISGFFEGNAEVGGGYKSAGGRIGLRIEL